MNDKKAIFFNLPDNSSDASFFTLLESVMQYQGILQILHITVQLLTLFTQQLQTALQNVSLQHLSSHNNLHA